ELARGLPSGGRPSNAEGTYPEGGYNFPKGWAIPHGVGDSIRRLKEQFASGGACVRLASWWGNGSPRRRSVAGLRGRTDTLGLRHGPDPYGRQQGGIVRIGAKPDDATPRGG